MKHTCKFCQHTFDSARKDAEFCSTKCRVYHGRGNSPLAEPIKAPAERKTQKELIPSPKAEDGKMSRVRAIVESICASKHPYPRPVWCRDSSGNPKPWPDMEDVKFRLYGGNLPSLASIMGEKTFGGIKGYNKTQLRQCQPWHCCTVAALTHLLLSLGCQPLKMLKEVAEIGYLPDPSEVEALP